MAADTQTPLNPEDAAAVAKFIHALSDQDMQFNLMEYAAAKRATGEYLSHRALMAYMRHVLSTSPEYMHTAKDFFNEIYVLAKESGIFPQEDLPTPDEVRRIVGQNRE